MIFSWQNDVFVVAEPGELADKFLQSVKQSLSSVTRIRRRKASSFLANISTISDLVACKPIFQIGGIVHRYIGRQTQVAFLYSFFVVVHRLKYLSINFRISCSTSDTEGYG